MDGSDQDSATDVFKSGLLTTPSDDPKIESLEQASLGEAEVESDEHIEQQQEYMDGELIEPDGQRSSVSLDEDGGTHFEGSQSQETVIRRGFPPVSLPETGRCESPTGLDISGDNNVVFDPVQRLNFDDDEDEDVDNDNEGEYYSDAAQSYDPLESEMHQRPVVNGSEQGESARSSGFRSLHDQGQNVRIIEGHDSSFLDDAPQQVQQPASYGFNFLHTQMIQLPTFSGLNASGLTNNGGTSPGFPINHSRLLSEEEQTHNMYDSLEREDGSSILGEGIHNHVAGEDTDDLQQYFSSGERGSIPLPAANGVGHQHQFHNHHHHHGDNEAFWDHDDSSDHGSYLSNSHPHPVISDSASSPQHGRLQSPPRNFQVELCAAHTIPPSDSSFFSSGRQGDGFHSPLERDSGSVGEDDPQNFDEDNTDPLNAELSEEGLLQDTQMYAQPVTSASNLVNSASLQRDAAGNNFLQSYNTAQCSASGLNLSQTANSKARQQMDNPQQTPPKNLAWSQSQHQPVVELSTESGGIFDGPSQGDRRQAGAGRSVSCKDLPQAAALNMSGGAIPKKPQTQGNRVQQKRRPAVQGSASSNDSNKLIGTGLRATSQPPARKAGVPGATGNDKARQKQGIGQRITSLPEVGRGTLLGSSDTSSLHQGRQLQGKMSTGSPLASRANSHTSLASSAGSTNSRVSGVGKESHLVRSQKIQQGGQMPTSTVQEGKHSSLAIANKSHGISASTGQSVMSALPNTTLPRQVSAQNRPSPANQQEKTRNTLSGKQHVGESEKEEHLHHNMPSQVGNPHTLKGFPQQGRSHARPHQNVGRGNLSGNHIPQSLNGQGGHPLGKQHYRYSHGSSQGHDQGHKQQSLQHNLSVQASGASPRGSDGALLSGASPSGSEGSHRSVSHESVMSQMEALRKQGHRLSPAEVSSIMDCVAVFERLNN